MAESVSLGQRVVLLRRLRRLTQRELAEAVGVSPQTISNWERGVSEVPSADIPNLAAALGVSVAQLFSAETTVIDIDPQAGDSGGSSDVYNVAPLEDPHPLGARPLPIYRWGSLGDPRDRDSSPHPDREDYPPSGRERLIGPHGFGVEVKGDSMVGRDLHDGDVCWINPERTYRLGDLVLALVTDSGGDSGMVVKTYAHTEVGECLLSETAQGKTPVACSEFKIVGPVVGVQRWFPPR